jgi:hypothetical protein
MTVGLSSANFVDAILDALSASTATLICSHVIPHTADPGAAGTTGTFTSTSLGTTRHAITWGTKAGTDPRSRPIAATFPTWSVTGSGTVSHVSVWNASTAGTFRFSVTLTTPRAVVNTDTLNLTAMSLSFTPVAA